MWYVGRGLGSPDGAAVGSFRCVGRGLGTSVEGALVGCVGRGDGAIDGASVGCVGRGLGTDVGGDVGLSVWCVGLGLGIALVGRVLGFGVVGCGDGPYEGAPDGAAVVGVAEGA